MFFVEDVSGAARRLGRANPKGIGTVAGRALGRSRGRSQTLAVLRSSLRDDRTRPRAGAGMAIGAGWWQGSSRKSRRRNKARERRRVPEVPGLELRELMTIVRPQITVAAIPPILPPTGGTALVTVVGQIASTRENVHDGFYRVTDEYRRVEPFGDIALTPLGPSGGYYRFGFEFKVPLQAQSKSDTASGGRQYFLLVGATDQDNTEGQTITVFVPTTRPPARAPFAGPRVRPAFRGRGPGGLSRA